MTRILTLDEKVPSLLAATLTDKPIASLGYNKAYETAALFILSCNAVTVHRNVTNHDCQSYATANNVSKGEPHLVLVRWLGYES